MQNLIIPANTAIETFRDSGYKNTASAIAELIDNSIEAKATTIQILTFEHPVFKKSRTNLVIEEIGIYDDGIGMSKDVLNICLQFGNGTRLKSRTGIGRFGIGLPNASISQCRRIEVFSWQKGKCYSTYLDVDEVRDNKQDRVNPVAECELPLDYLKNIEGELKEHGTFVLWKKCDRLDMKRSITLYNTISNDLCRIYRHFLDDDNGYGYQCTIDLIATGNDRSVYRLKANDPLYLMTPNNTPGFENEATNEALPIIKLSLPYNDEGDEGIIEIRFSIAKPEIQKMGGNSRIGKHYARNTGISFVRAAREIDFGVFDFFNAQEERQRWWGCEIRFEPVFDELFGVTNNKQAIRGISYLDRKQFKEMHDEGEDIEALINSDLRLKLRSELSKIFHHNHEKIYKNEIVNRHAGKNSGKENENEISPSEKVANDEFENNKQKTVSSIKGENLSDEEKKQEWQKRESEKSPEMAQEELAEIVETRSKLKIAKDFASWPGNGFLTVEPVGEICVCVINTRHPFYTDLYEPLLNRDESLVNELDVLLITYARAVDEMYDYQDEIEHHREKWGEHLKRVLKRLKEEAL